MREKLYLFFKRLFDILFSLIAIVLLPLPWLIIAIVIKIQSPGPVMYRARRIGRDGKIFILYKFRTMRVDSGNVHITTLRTDERIFPFGRFLRKSKLDETLQFINILKGDMSIIGPRPEDEGNASELYIGEYSKILSVKPGLSSPASLYDYTHGELYSDEYQYVHNFLPIKMDVELYYIENRSSIYDIKITIMTAVIMICIIFGKKTFKEPYEVRLCKENKKKYTTV